jgi:hypothetical protein
MNMWRRWGTLAVLSLSLPAWAGADGRWRLVEQTYQRGGNNLAPIEAPVRLEVTLGPDGPTGRIWAGADEGGALAWPAFVTGGSARPVAVLGRAARDGAFEVRYRVEPAPGDDLVLDVVERYAAGADGDSLEGTVEVRFTGGSMNRGGYTLHRRFVRER